MMKDNVDIIIEQWQKELPDLETEAMGTLGRLNKFVKNSERKLGENFSRFELNSGEFDVLATLRRSGGAYQLKPTDLYNQLMVTSGAMTNRIDTLEKKGLVERIHDTLDRRAIYVKLTEAGFKLVNRAVYEHVSVESRLLEKLTDEERQTLDCLLRKLLD